MMKKYLMFLFISMLMANFSLFAQAGAPAAAGAGAAAPDSGSERAAARETNPANPTPFEAAPGELVSEETDFTALSEDDKSLLKRNLRSEEVWKNADYRDYSAALAELHKLSKSFANNKYRLALSAYQSGVNVIIKMRDNVQMYRKESAEAKNMDEKWYWQIVDRKTREEREIGIMQRKAKMEATTYFSKAINHLDDIKNAELREKPGYKKLLSAVYRNWTMYQYDLGNLPQCIPILNLYLEIDENEKEYPAHRYLAQCYAFQENMIKKYKAGTEDQMFRFRYKKNVHLLRASELKYGKDSPEYRQVVNLVNKDEIISVQP